MQDYIEFCKAYFNATNIPITCYRGDVLLYSSIAEALGIKPLNHYNILAGNRNPDFCMFRSTTMYGLLRVEDTDYLIILGAAYNVPVSDDLLREYMHENAVLSEHREMLKALLNSIPIMNQIRFMKHLAFLHQCLNHQTIDVFQHFVAESEEQTQLRAENHVNQIVESKENKESSVFHNSYYYEQGIYQLIKEGNSAQLSKYLTDTSIDLQEGRMASTPLRQAKNIFIGTVTKAAMLGAIPGGMDPEEAYTLVDLYSQECEQMGSLQEIGNLYYPMYMDFCGRVEQSHIPEGLSKEVYLCMTFIKSHTNENIGIDDVARYIDRSPSYTIKRFKEELGINIGAFIMRCKLEEAKSLLTFSDKSLSEISEYLCFSNQSHFQNVFKKKYGVTPLQYRKQHHT